MLECRFSYFHVYKLDRILDALRSQRRSESYIP